MPTIYDQNYLKICAELASCLSVSLASARRRIDLVAAKSGLNDLESRKAIALELLDEARSQSDQEKSGSNSHLDELLKATAEDENFMLED